MIFFKYKFLLSAEETMDLILELPVLLTYTLSQWWSKHPSLQFRTPFLVLDFQYRRHLMPCKNTMFQIPERTTAQLSQSCCDWKWDDLFGTVYILHLLICHSSFFFLFFNRFNWLERNTCILANETKFLRKIANLSNIQWTFLFCG